MPQVCPLGSVLGPLLLLTYINNLPDLVRSNLKIFADDITLFVTVAYDKHLAVQELNIDLQNMKTWADQ